MDVLIVGSKGREHAIAWKLAQSPNVRKIFIAPGNAGTAEVGENVPAKTSPEILAWLKDHPVDLVAVTQDTYLADGLVDDVARLSIPVFGPSQAAAEIEWSKAFAKELMQEDGIPTARYKTFTDLGAARAYARTQSLPVVIKASGLMAGKGVTIAHSYEEADQTLNTMNGEVVIEEFMQGMEISVHAFTDGTTAVMLPSSKDHKTIYDGDKGPMTGGMGTVAPVPRVTDAQMQEIEKRIVIPLVRGLKKRGRPFVGVLYPGIMLTAEGPKVIEVNARFGDPETESYMRLLDADLLEIFLACINGTLKNVVVRWKQSAAATIVVAEKSYPGPATKGAEIHGIDEAEQDTDVVVFHFDTARIPQLVVNGGRILGVTATGSDLKDALKKAYAGVEKIHFDGMHYRKDIGKSVI